MIQTENKLKDTGKRVLCLHGIGTSPEIFEAQTAALRYRLGDGFDFEYIGGGHPWPAARGIPEVFGGDEVCYSYFDGSASGALEALEDLVDYVNENGPFYAVMGFSLGAALAVMLLMNGDKMGFVDPPFKLAILLCCILPRDWDALQAGKLDILDFEKVTSRIRIPTIHCWSPQDEEYPGESSRVVEMCDMSSCVNLQHSAGHSVPTQTSGVEELVEAIRAFSRAANLQT